MRDDVVEEELSGRIMDPVGSTGLVTLKMSERLFRFENKQMPDNTTLTVRVIRNKEFNDEYYERIDTNLTWNCTSYNESTMVFQVNFTEPMNISFESMAAFDTLCIEIHDRFFFSSADSLRTVPENYTMKLPLPI